MAFFADSKFAFASASALAFSSAAFFADSKFAFASASALSFSSAFIKFSCLALFSAISLALASILASALNLSTDSPESFKPEDLAVAPVTISALSSSEITIFFSGDAESSFFEMFAELPSDFELTLPFSSTITNGFKSSRGRLSSGASESTFLSSFSMRLCISLTLVLCSYAYSSFTRGLF